MNNSSEVEWKLVYSMIVAGKSAKFANNKCKLLHKKLGDFPLTKTSNLAIGAVEVALRYAATGRYELLAQGLVVSAVLATHKSLACLSLAELQNIPGVGPKTARFFLVWCNPEHRLAVLDTHVLAWLQAQGYTAPKATPSSTAQYSRLEQAFLNEADKRNMSPRELDLEIWRPAAAADNILPVDISQDPDCEAPWGTLPLEDISSIDQGSKAC